jgi:putative ABC transport system ATP-binding protein
MEDTQADMTILLKLVDVVKIYESRQVKTPALRGINLEIRPGETVLITGPSGSGKSTLLNLFGMLDTPSAGKLLIKGEDTSIWTQNDIEGYKRDSIGFVFQNSNLFPNLTVWQNLWMELHAQKITDGEKEKRISEYLNVVSLGEKSGNYPDELSGGERQRIAVLSALIKSPSIVIADEPTAELDMKNKEKTIELLFELQEVNPRITIIIASHDDLFKERVHRVINIVDGLITKDAINQPGLMGNHEAVHAEIEELSKILSCPRCGNRGVKKFQNDQNLKVVDTKVIGQATIYCDQCGFSESKEFILHVLK